MLEHFHEGNMTYKSNGIREKVPDTFVEISPELAKERGVQSVPAYLSSVTISGASGGF